MFAKAEVKVLSVDEAKEILASNTFERQRKANRNTVGYYRDQMLAGAFLDGTTIELAGYPNGEGQVHWVLTDGQQRLMAQVSAGVNMEYIIRRVIVRDEAEVASRYGRIDIGRSRSLGDFVRAVRLDQETGLAIDDAKRLVAAVSFLTYNFSHADRYAFSPDERVNMARQYSLAANVYIELITGAMQAIRHALVRTASFSVALATLDEATGRYGDDFVHRFWTGIASDDGLRANDPRKVAVNHLREAVMRNTPGKRMVSSAYSARYIANCWNAYADNRQISYSKVFDAYAPIVIKGTSWDGTKR